MDTAKNLLARIDAIHASTHPLFVAICKADCTPAEKDEAFSHLRIALWALDSLVTRESCAAYYTSRSIDLGNLITS